MHSFFSCSFSSFRSLTALWASKSKRFARISHTLPCALCAVWSHDFVRLGACGESVARRSLIAGKRSNTWGLQETDTHADLGPRDTWS